MLSVTLLKVTRELFVSVLLGGIAGLAGADPGRASECWDCAGVTAGVLCRIICPYLSKLATGFQFFLVFILFPRANLTITAGRAGIPELNLD